MFVLFFFNDTATTEIYTLSLHDALPIYGDLGLLGTDRLHARGVLQPDHQLEAGGTPVAPGRGVHPEVVGHVRSEEHTSELQSRQYLVCRLLLEKKKKQPHNTTQNSYPFI